MDCQEQRTLASAFIDGELAPEERRRIESHIEHCADCREYLERLQRMADAVRALPPVDMPEGAASRLSAALREEISAAETKTSRSWLKRLSGRPAWTAAGSLAAAAVIAVSIIVASGPGAPNSGVMMRDAQEEAAPTLQPEPGEDLEGGRSLEMDTVFAPKELRELARQAARAEGESGAEYKTVAPAEHEAAALKAVARAAGGHPAHLISARSGVFSGKKATIVVVALETRPRQFRAAAVSDQGKVIFMTDPALPSNS